ncbi:putative exported protein [Rhodovastum atsumiense]|uniref:Cupredoxin domain-containing protein n=1 Tax=Rhodovastum atsumiense TaxID=504468 RepID=A0A5M6IIN7_9PROT|nr:cupredoxin domain-containing protein [Rhodovastum atsumiense]KAA5608120.1 cupredoxin domain-containing protein [Rhodovastum atsumiense]CAH2600768.1 putative exported protein [Rhodovastum atsumiense]
MQGRFLLLVNALAFAGALAAAPVARADEMPVFRIIMKDGTIEPTRLEVPANQPFKLEISNTGVSPVEFESASLHKEKVLIGGATSSLVFRRLAPGEYDFFDDFHPDAKAVLIAR